MLVCLAALLSEAAAPAARLATPAQLKSTIGKAIAAEKAALKALDANDLKSVRSDLERSLSDLRGALAGAKAGGAADAGAVSPLNQAILKDESALEVLDKPRERDRVRSQINNAIVAKERAEQVFTSPTTTETTTETTTTKTTTTETTTTTATAGPPEGQSPMDAAKGIAATFVQSDFATFYSVELINTGLYPATVEWSFSPPKEDTACNGFLPAPGHSAIRRKQKKKLNLYRKEWYDSINGHEPTGTQLDTVAVWWHADVTEPGGLCNHAGNAYNPTGYGHDGTISVTVENKLWVCKASFRGTQTGGSSRKPDAPMDLGYPNGWRGPATCTKR